MFDMGTLKIVYRTQFGYMLDMGHYTFGTTLNLVTCIQQGTTQDFIPHSIWVHVRYWYIKDLVAHSIWLSL